MMKYRVDFCFLILFLITPFIWADELAAPECEILEKFEDINPASSTGGNGLLWKISRKGVASSYVFGTIHVADEAIISLLDEVRGTLAQATIFAMEVVPQAKEMMTVASLMYFADGRKLSDLLSQPLFNKVVKLLSSYHLSLEAVTLLKPWAAFVTMSYPPEFGQVMDLQLLGIARNNDVKVTGLESLQEQLDIFNTMTLDKQVKILSDAACHYDVVEADFEKMKSLYSARDLAGLYNYSKRYSLSDDAVYNELIRKLLINRNYTMTQRMLPILENGNAFIAIGAMHLPGEEGVLALLAKYDYEISPVF